MSTSSPSSGRPGGWAKVRDGARARGRVIFVKQSVHLRHSVKEVTAALVGAGDEWFPRNADNVPTVGLRVAGVPLQKQVVVEIGEPVETTTWAMVPLTWRAAFPSRLFPKLTGKIEFDPVGRDKAKLTVSGRYSPPLGRLGKSLDDAVMHRVAEATVKELAEAIAVRLEDSFR